MSLLRSLSPFKASCRAKAQRSHHPRFRPADALGSRGARQGSSNARGTSPTSRRESPSHAQPIADKISRLSLAFNSAFALLAARFDYPDILREPTADVLAKFRAGGTSLVLLWWAFALTAVLMGTYTAWSLWLIATGIALFA
jgi:hypothetical protein